MLDENYYQITGWMLNRLGLKGVQLNVYAIIYGFSQDGETEFQGCVQYLCDACGVSSRNTIRVALNELVEKGYILRREEYINNVKYVRYRASLEALSFGGGSQNLSTPAQKLSRGVVNNCTGGSQNLSRGIANFDHNNNINNNNHNDINNISPDFQKKSAIKTEIESEFEQIWKLYPRKEEKKRALSAYVKARTKKDNPCTFEQVLAGVERYRKHTANKESQYIKTGATWFNGECWNDEYSAPTATEKNDDPDIEKYKCLINKF